MIDGVRQAEVLLFSFFFFFDSHSTPIQASEGRRGSEASTRSLPHTNVRTHHNNA